MQKAKINKQKLPENIAVILEENVAYSSNGCSNEKTYFFDGAVKYYLKTGNKYHLEREYRMTNFLNTHKIATKAVAFESNDDNGYLLTKALNGIDGTDAYYLGKPKELAVVFGESLRLLHSCPLKGCPFPDKNNEFVEDGLKGTLKNLKEHDYLLKNANLLQNNTVIHGDYCLPNIILNNHEFVGLIDLGYGGIGDKHFDLAYGLWTLNHNLKTDAYNKIFLQAYGYDEVDMERLKLCRIINNNS